MGPAVARPPSAAAWPTRHLCRGFASQTRPCRNRTIRRAVCPVHVLWETRTGTATGETCMDLTNLTSSAVSAGERLAGGLGRFARLERVLGGLLVLTPFILIVADDWDLRDSISAYHDVAAPSAFYVPLTAGAMLFLVNGIVRDAHVYNVLLGLALSGVVLFDHDGWTSIPHLIFAIGFFAGNVVVMLFFSTNKSLPLKIVLVGGVALAGVLWGTQVITLFWAEWVSLAVVAVHYILDSVSWSQYRALRPNEPAKLLP